MYEDELFEKDTNNETEERNENVEEEDENEGDLDFGDLGIEYED